VQGRIAHAGLTLGTLIVVAAFAPAAEGGVGIHGVSVQAARPDHGTVRVRRAGHVPRNGHATRVTPAISVRVRGRLSSPLRLRARVHGVSRSDVRAGRVVVARRTGRRWHSLKTRSVAGGRSVEARLSRGGIYAAYSRSAGVGLSFGDVMDSFGDAVNGMVWKFNTYTGNSGPQPNCTGKPSPPNWAQFDGDMYYTKPLMACARGEGDVIAVEMTNNRPYGVIMHFPVTPKWAWVEDGVHLSETVQVPYKPVDGLYLAPTSRASVGIARGAWSQAAASFIAKPTQQTVYLDVLQTVLENTGAGLSGLMTSQLLTADCGVALYQLGDDVLAGGIRGKLVASADAAYTCLTSAIRKGVIKGGSKEAVTKKLSKLKNAIGLAQLATKYGELIVALKFEITGGFTVTDRTWRPASATPAPPAPPPSGGTPTAPQPQPQQTWAETTGGAANTWTNPANAGGTQGPTIASNQTVQIACKLQGFRVADGNTWWYRIASSPWNNQYYVSADAFYNNGQTSGSLHGTPFVDPNVKDC
jgi:hypothetical protein